MRSSISPIRLRIFGFCALPLVLLLACEKVPEGSPHFFTDAEGRALIFRGSNVDNAAKSHPKHQVDISDEEIEVMAKDMGFNFVRYLIFWSGVEPEPGKYNDRYLDQVIADIKRFQKHKMWVLIDMHQDVYAAKFCCDGAPEWAIRDDGKAFELQDLWAANYFEPAVQASFDNFWAYTDGEHADLQDHYAEMWAHVAKRLRDVPGVLGYDIMNEPHPGSAFSLEEVLTRVDSEASKDFDIERLGPFHQRVINAIRQEDSERYIVFEPRYGSPGNGSPSWHEPLVDPREGPARLAYGPHLYSLSLEANGVYAGGDKDPTLKLWKQEREKELKRQPMPLLLGEWGLAFGAVDSDVYLREMMEMGEKMLLSWAHWSWDPGSAGNWTLYNRDKKSPNPMFQVVDRPYPQATAGEPRRLSFDAESHTLEYEWAELEGVNGETEVLIPLAREGGDKVVVELSDPKGAWSFSWDKKVPGLLKIKADPKQKTHTLVVRPKG